MDIKNLILSKYLTKRGQINTKALSADITERLIQETNFMYPNSTIPQRWFVIKNNLKKQPVCNYCGGKVNYSSTGFNPYCSNTCNFKANPDKLKKRGENIRQAFSNRPQKKKDLHSQRIKTAYSKLSLEQKKRKEEKKKKTCLKRYGKEHVGGISGPNNSLHKNSEGRKKRRETMIKKYGTEYPNQNLEIKEKLKRTYAIKYREKFSSLIEKIKELYLEQELTMTETAEKLGLPYATLQNHMYKAEIPIRQLHRVSSHEKLIQSYLSELNVDFKMNDKILLEHVDKRKSLELDILIPSKNIAIEINGVHWHSDKYIDKNKVTLKFDECAKKGYRLLTLFESEIIHNLEKIKSILAVSLNIVKEKIPARKCEIIELSSLQYKEFCEDNHIQGNANSSIKIGLMYKQELISVMSFSKPRFNSNFEWELVRYCNKKFTTIIGGAEKLFSYFLKTYNPENIICYSDRRLFSGNIYIRLGFKQTRITGSNYYYVIGDKTYPRQMFQKHLLKDKLPNFDPGLSEIENMDRNNIKRIYDCGNLVFEWKRIN